MYITKLIKVALSIQQPNQQLCCLIVGALHPLSGYTELQYGGQVYLFFKTPVQIIHCAQWGVLSHGKCAKV